MLDPEKLKNKKTNKTLFDQNLTQSNNLMCKVKVDSDVTKLF